MWCGPCAVSSACSGPQKPARDTHHRRANRVFLLSRRVGAARRCNARRKWRMQKKNGTDHFFFFFFLPPHPSPRRAGDVAGGAGCARQGAWRHGGGCPAPGSVLWNMTPGSAHHSLSVSVPQLCRSPPLNPNHPLLHPDTQAFCIMMWTPTCPATPATTVRGLRCTFGAR